MMEEPLSQAASPSGDANFTGGGDLDPSTLASLEERILDIARNSTGVVRTLPTKKAKRVRFFRNGDKFYTGVVMAVTPERYRSFDSLASDLTRALVSSVTLPNGVRSIYTMDGKKVQSINDLEDGKCYVVSGQGEIFKKVEYSSSKVRRGSSLSGLPQSSSGTSRQISAIPLCVKARIVTLIRHGTKPRKVVRLLLNKRNAQSLEHALEAITEAVKLDSGAVRKVYTLSGQQITSLDQFFERDEIFLAYGPEKSTPDDFELDFEESKSVQSFRRCPWVSKRQSGPMPRMPKKSGKKGFSTPQIRTPSPSTLILPQPLRLHYAVGHVIGDGNFAVVRHCIDKSTGAEYAIKIVDKYKCQGKETMLASEVAILRQVCHPNIISLISEQETTDQLFLVMELVKGGDLFDAIAAATKFSEAEASVMISHLTSALAYLHSHHIVHRDVKPENLLVEMDGSHVRCLKLGDFGLAQVVREPLYAVCGTPTYVAPEILAETGYGLKIDVWAAGVILYILLCGFPPFVSVDNEQEELFERILSGQYEFISPFWDNISDSAKQLISNMLQAAPELRFSAEDVLDHPWLMQSFLGGKQTATTTASPSNSTQQHWDQQRQPIRLATFEFDYKKQRQIDNSQEEVTGGAIRNIWGNNKSIINSSNDEVDFVSYYPNREEEQQQQQQQQQPVSLSAECIQDINNLSQSMDNLINNLNQTQEHRSNSTSSLHSVSKIEFECQTYTQTPNRYKNSHVSDNCIPDALKNKNNVITSSVDSLTGSSSNDIETSDSFVNIQLAQLVQRKKTDSTQSLESTDSFENLIRFFNRNDSNRNTYNNKDNIKQQFKSNSKISTKSTTKILSPRVVGDSKNFKPINSSKRSIPTKEVLRNYKDSVKLRDDKTKNESKGKRFSCSTLSASKKITTESPKSIDRFKDNIVKDRRRYNSTDELREDVLTKQSVKTKRFSLYYTPQPLRKSYEVESKTGKNSGKFSEKDINKKDTQKGKCRKSLFDSPTANTRNKSNNKQNVHVKSGV